MCLCADITGLKRLAAAYGDRASEVTRIAEEQMLGRRLVRLHILFSYYLPACFHTGRCQVLLPPTPFVPQCCVGCTASLWDASCWCCDPELPVVFVNLMRGVKAIPNGWGQVGWNLGLMHALALGAGAGAAAAGGGGGVHGAPRVLRERGGLPGAPHPPGLPGHRGRQAGAAAGALPPRHCSALFSLC